MNNQFKRILDLVRRTGDRMVVTDPEGEQAVVIMDFDEYEAIIEALGTAEFDYFDDDLALEQTTQPVPPTPEPPVQTPNYEPESPSYSPNLTDEAFPNENLANLSEESTEENDDGEDEQFYLEPVE